MSMAMLELSLAFVMLFCCFAVAFTIVDKLN